MALVFANFNGKLAGCRKGVTLNKKRLAVKDLEGSIPSESQPIF
jgi:hypothetical protein|nr:MAG TPA: hypothetical protein [Bacteriophage sp.]